MKIIKAIPYEKLPSYKKRQFNGLKLKRDSIIGIVVETDTYRNDFLTAYVSITIQYNERKTKSLVHNGRMSHCIGRISVAPLVREKQIDIESFMYRDDVPNQPCDRWVEDLIEQIVLQSLGTLTITRDIEKLNNPLTLTIELGVGDEVLMGKISADEAQNHFSFQ